MKATVRQTAVAGRFYPGDPAEVQHSLQKLMPEVGETRARGIMVPHAGWVYSGGVAGEVFGSLVVPDTVVILCPNHTGRGPRISVAACAAFAVPGGEIAVDLELAQAIIDATPGAEADLQAHAGEHAIEVELPFVQARNPAARIVPIVLGPLASEESIELGRTLARVLAGRYDESLVVASSDMSHYLPDQECRRVDKQALEPLLAFDPERLCSVVHEQRISMCGVIPTAVMLSYAREVGAAQPTLVRYATSGDAFGDRSQVVGYAGVVLGV